MGICGNMKKRCSKCGYRDTDMFYDKELKKKVDRKIVERCYRADAPNIELCPKCKEVL